MTNKLKLIIRTIAVAVAASWNVGDASAQASYSIFSGGLESFNVTADGTTTDGALAGGIAMNYVSGNGSSFTSVCTDISGTLYLGNTYSYSAPTPFAGNTGLDPTWGAGNGPGLVLNNLANEQAAINAAADIFYVNNSVLSGSDVNAKAGLQLAVWCALYDTSAGETASQLAAALTSTGSRFYLDANQTTGNTTTWSGGWGSTSLGTSTAIADAVADLSNVNFSAQFSGNLLIPSPNVQYGLTAQEVFTNVTPVPETKTLIAGGLLLLPFVASSLRSRIRRI